MEIEEGSEVQAEDEDDSGCTQQPGILGSEWSQRTWRLLGFTESKGFGLPQTTPPEDSCRCYLILAGKPLVKHSQP